MAGIYGGAIINGESMAANITSSTLDISDYETISLQLVAASSTHVGTVAVNISDDGTNWNAVTLDSTPTAASGSAFNATVQLSDIGARYLQVVYTAGSGAGTLYCYANMKD